MMRKQEATGFSTKSLLVAAVLGILFVVLWALVASSQTQPLDTSEMQSARSVVRDVPLTAIRAVGFWGAIGVYLVAALMGWYLITRRSA